MVSGQGKGITALDAEGEVGEFRRRWFSGEGKLLGIEGKQRSRLAYKQRRIRSLGGCCGGDGLCLYALRNTELYPRMR